VTDIHKIAHINHVYPWHCGAVTGYETTNDKGVNCPDCLAMKPVDTDGFHFPKAKFADELPSYDEDMPCQIEHVGREYKEFTLEDPGTEGELIEAWDVIHVFETWLRIRQREGADIEAAKRAVYEKNNARGYYK